MIIQRKSPLTGELNSREIDICQSQIDAWDGGMLIQDAMPDVSKDDREFIMSGSTPVDWDKMFGGFEDES
tara:strand:+ start:328 stop:537 length:210 start_codon:yes stop_codon:yes gene_type:complete